MELLEKIRTLARNRSALVRVRLLRFGRQVRRRTEPWRRLPGEFHYYVEIPAEPGQMRNLLENDPLVYPLSFFLARVAVLLRPESGDSLPVRLHFEVTARSIFPAGLALRWYARRIRTQLEHLANHLYFQCLAAPLAPPDWSPALIQSADFPSLDRRNFRQPGTGLRQARNRLLQLMHAPAEYPARDYFYHYLVQPGYPQTLSMEDVLLIELALPENEFETLLPPPFRLSGFAPPSLLLIVARETAIQKSGLSSDRPALRWELRAPVRLLTRSNYLHGWLPLEACRVPLDRLRWPFDAASGSLRRYEEGLRFCAGERAGDLLYHCVYRPRRGLTAGDGLPAYLSGENRVFIQSADSLDINVFREEADFAINHVRVAVDETRTFEHHHRTGPLAHPAEFYGDRFSLSPEIPEEALYLRRLASRLSFDFHVSLRDTNYRAHPASLKI